MLPSGGLGAVAASAPVMLLEGIARDFESERSDVTVVSRPTVKDRRLIGPATVVLAVAAVAALHLIRWSGVNAGSWVDLDVYVRGAHDLVTQAALYETQAGVLPFTYSPFAAVVFTPLAPPELSGRVLGHHGRFACQLSAGGRGLRPEFEAFVESCRPGSAGRNGPGAVCPKPPARSGEPLLDGAGGGRLPGDQVIAPGMAGWPGSRHQDRPRRLRPVLPAPAGLALGTSCGLRLPGDRWCRGGHGTTGLTEVLDGWPLRDISLEAGGGR